MTTTLIASVRGPVSSRTRPTRSSPSSAGSSRSLSAADGSVRRELPALPGAVTEVSSVPAGRWITYTQLDARTEPCSASPALVQANADGSDAARDRGRRHRRVADREPGRAVGRVPEIGVPERECRPPASRTSKPGRTSSWRSRQSGAGEWPMAFTPDSSRLLISDGDAYALVSVPDGSRHEAVDLPQTSPIAAFISAHEVARTRGTTGSRPTRSWRSMCSRGGTRTVRGSRSSDHLADVRRAERHAARRRDQRRRRDERGVVTYDAQGAHLRSARSPGSRRAPGTHRPSRRPRRRRPGGDRDHDLERAHRRPTTTTTTAPFTESTLPPPTGVAGFTRLSHRRARDARGPVPRDARPPQAKVDELVAFLRDEPIEGRKGAEGVVTRSGNRAEVEVRRVLGSPATATLGSTTGCTCCRRRPARDGRS